MSHITLRRAAEQALESLEGELPGWRTPAQERAITALRAALDAALAEPSAKREPATEEQLREAHMGRGVALLPHFRIGWREAEAWHGIKTEDKT